MSDPQHELDIELQPGEHTDIEVEGRGLLVSRIGNDYYVIDNTCSHGRARLSEGRLRGTTITCPRHGGTFDVTTGACTGRPAVANLRAYRVTSSNNRLVAIEID